MTVIMLDLLTLVKTADLRAACSSTGLASNRSVDLTGRDGDRHIDIATDRIRVRADGVSTLDAPFSRLLVDASNGHGKRGGQREASCFISTKVDPGDDVDFVIGKVVAAIPAHMKDRILKAGCITAGEELFGIGRIAPSAKRPGQRELEVEQTVFATVTATARRDFCAI
jgi:hypothetical protein